MRPAEIDRIEELCGIAREYHKRNGKLPTGSGLDVIDGAERMAKALRSQALTAADREALIHFIKSAPGRLPSLVQAFLDRLIAGAEK